MVSEITKANLCKRLIDPNDCLPSCVKGYDFFIGGNHYQKCRYGCFEFFVTDENVTLLAELIEKERTIRGLG
jgi:hypothetical protein